MRIMNLAESVMEIEIVRIREPDAEVFSCEIAKPGAQPIPGVLYICPGSEQPENPDEMTAAVFCGEVPELMLEHGSVFQTEMTPEQALVRISRALTAQARLDSACARLVAVTAAGKGVQSVLDCAYTLVGNPMILIDSSYKLIACNADILSFREDIAEQQKRGFVLSENIEEMKKERIYENIRQARYPCYSVQTRDGVKTGWMNALVYADGMEVAQLGVPEINRSFEAADFEIVHFLCKLLSIELQKSDAFRRNMGLMHSVLLCDLLDGLIPDENTARLRAEQLEWNLGERMCLLTVFDAASGMFERKARRIAEKVQALFARSRWALFDNRVVFILPREQLEEGGETLDALKSDLANNGLACAGSAEFSALLDARTAYEQTLRSYEIGSRLSPGEVLFRYEACVCQHIGQLLRENGNLRSFCHPGVLRLAEEESAHDAKLLSTLRTYLQYPNDPGEAAQKLYIHKNTLFYRMHKIREDYGLNLADGTERLWIQMTLEFLNI